MTQTLQVTVPIPETHVIISKVEYQELIDSKPVNMTLTEVAKAYPTYNDWIVKNICEDPYLRKIIEPFSLLPNVGEKSVYKFNRRRMLQFLDEYDEEIKIRSKKRSKKNRQTI
ncbi:DUF771 domain-containing protein [Staphylococcus saprophyticus]|uniref:DUF771 domain-containing protein n=1 Tax=Staphylococcus saprophyticus TaxID=29385 RepID=UPI0029792CDA|nr:DUF771 domain-containing protein [Staphylococcus saprophyticus]MDW4460290.1 DUF771 domain-containing protein [Staphylococcus saprophyticus]